MRPSLPSPCRTLGRFASILVTGADARSFLQGQVSVDINGLAPGRMELASCNSSQGRVQAVLWIVERSEGLVLIVPAEMRDVVITRLKKYVLRAKVTIEADPFVVAGATDITGLEGERAHATLDDGSLILWPGVPRVLVLLRSTQAVTADPEFDHWWHLEDIRAGLPQVYAATHEAFVAQMLNIDLLGGIGFEKGCYTGQEIIARAHFRGTVKRRMFRFSATCAPPAPGSRIVSQGNHAGDVVDAAATAEGCELLAVISLAQRDAVLSVDGAAGSTLRPLTLPYGVVDEEHTDLAPATSH